MESINAMYQLTCESAPGTKNIWKPHWLRFAGVLALLLVLPTIVQAQFTYTTNNGALIITKYTGSGGDVTIPDTVDGLPVTSIGDMAFIACSSLTNVTFGNSITNIGDWAFRSCSSLTKVTLPNCLTSLGNWAFSGCSSLTNITLPNGLTNIGHWALDHCYRLPAITLPNTVTEIKTNVFYYCTNLTSITLPNSITNIGIDAFTYCASLTNVLIGNGLLSIDRWGFRFCTNLASIYFLGNAPKVNTYAFYTTAPTLYYLPGTTGWSNPFAGCPAKLWNPRVQASGPGFGVRNNRFGFNITGTANIPLAIETCTDLANGVWQPLQTCTLTNGSIYFSDPAWTSSPSRTYRLRSP